MKKKKRNRRKREFTGFKDPIPPVQVEVKKEEFEGFADSPTPDGLSFKSKAPQRGDIDEETGLFYDCGRDGYGRWVPHLGGRVKRTNPKNYPRQCEISNPFEDSEKLGIIW